MSPRHYITESFTLDAFMCTRLFQDGLKLINQAATPAARFTSSQAAAEKQANTGGAESVYSRAPRRAAGAVVGVFFLLKA